MHGMDKWESHLHWTFREEHVLLPSIILNSFSNFILAMFLVASVCLFERLSALLLECHWTPRFISYSKLRKLLWRTSIYWIGTFLRLCYMLAAMTFHLGLILVIVTSLSTGQFLIEYWKVGNDATHLRDDDESRVSLIHAHPLDTRGNEEPGQYSRIQTKPKPKIFIRPSDSNIARAEAAALKIGIGSDDKEPMQDEVYRGTETGRMSTGKSKTRQTIGSRQRTNDFQGEDEYLMGESDSGCESP